MQVCDGVFDCPGTETTPEGEEEDNCGNYKGGRQKLLSGFFPLREAGGTPHSAKLFWHND